MDTSTHDCRPVRNPCRHENDLVDIAAQLPVRPGFVDNNCNSHRFPADSYNYDKHS